MPIQEIFNSIAPVILVLMGFGIMFRIIRLQSVIFFLLFLLFLPYLISAITGSFQSLFSAGLSWQGWLIVIGVGLIALRICLNSIFRRW